MSRGRKRKHNEMNQTSRDKNEDNINSDDEPEASETDGSQVEEDGEYDLYRQFDNKRQKLDEKYEERYKNIIKICKEQEPSLKKILQLDIPDKDLTWFIEHYNIMQEMDENTEERYRIKMLIYKRFEECQKTVSRRDLIEKLKDLGNIKDDLLTKILESKHNDFVKAILYKRYDKYINSDGTINTGSDEYINSVNWIDTVLDFPTGITKIVKTDINKQLIKLKESLDKHIYGLNKVKEEVIQSYCAMSTNSDYKKKFLALAGPPGVGKTAIGKAIAEAMGLPFDQISLGSIKDASVLTGHSSTYIGSAPGMFTIILKKAKTLSCVILLDEADKISRLTSEGQSISSVLLHVLDKTQNNKFKDMYMPEINIDLSNVFFIIAMNNEEEIDPTLKSRMHIVKINGYNMDEKIIIGSEYLLPKILTELKFEPNDITIPKETMKYLIEDVCEPELGVRDLDRKITIICEKINVLRNIGTSKNKFNLSYKISNLKFPINITIDTLKKLNMTHHK